MFLIVSLIAYAALGALLFHYIEYGDVTIGKDYHLFLDGIVKKIQNHSGKMHVR